MNNLVLPTSYTGMDAEEMQQIEGGYLVFILKPGQELPSHLGPILGGIKYESPKGQATIGKLPIMEAVPLPMPMPMPLRKALR